MFASLATLLRRAAFCVLSLMVPAADVAGKEQSDPSPTVASPSPVRVADMQCGAKPLGEVAFATSNNVPVVSASADGHPLSLVLDTGANRTVLTPTAAERIGAPAPKIEFDRHIQGIAGSVATREVELRNFTIGAVPIPWRRLTVAPITTAKVASEILDGLLGVDVLSGFDIDIDLPHSRLVLYDKRSCPLGPPWAVSHYAFSAGRSGAEHLFFPVELDGRTLTAIVDTGAQRTTLAARAAPAVGVTEAQLAQDRPIVAQGVTAEQLKSRVHRFSRLKIGNLTIRDPELVVTDLKLPDAEIILGVDLLKTRRIWLSYALQQVFLSDR
jgi:predicted aspartyl protease